MKDKENSPVQWEGYIFDEKPAIRMSSVSLTEKERATYIFKILNIEFPTDEQQRFAQFEVKLATQRGYFKDLVFLLASLMGKTDEYYNKRYVLNEE